MARRPRSPTDFASDDIKFNMKFNIISMEVFGKDFHLNLFTTLWQPFVARTCAPQVPIKSVLCAAAAAEQVHLVGFTSVYRILIELLGTHGDW